MYDLRVEEAVDGTAQPLSGGRARRVAVAGDQARLHRPAARAPAARVRRDLLQLGRLPGAAPAPLPQRLHLLAAGGGDRAPRGRGADLPLLLPAGRPGCGHTLREIAAELRPEERAGRTWSAICATWCARCASIFPRPARAQPDLQIQVLQLAFLPQQGRLRHRPADQRRTRRARSRSRSCRTSAASCIVDALLIGEDQLLVLFSFARAYFFVDMEVPAALRVVPALADAEEAARRALHGGRPRQAGQDALLPRPALPPEAFHRPVRASRPASRAW